MTTFADWLFTTDIDKDKNVLSTFSGEFNLADIEKGMETFISLLNQEGSLKGKKVGILIPQIPNFLQVFLAVNQLGGIVIPLGWQLRKDDLSEILSFLDPHIVLTVKDFNGVSFLDFVLEWANKTKKKTSIYASKNSVEWDCLYKIEGKERPLEVEPADIIACTSGSTGTPKGMMFNVEYIFDNYSRISSSLNLTKEDHLFQNINASQIYGIILLFMGLKVQCLTITPDTFDVLRIVNMIKQYKPTKLSSTPSLFRNIYTFLEKMNALDGFDHLRLCSVGGEMLPNNYVNQFSKLHHCRFMNAYGSSETGYLMYSAVDLREGDEWELCEEIDYKVIEDELFFKVPSMFLGYYKRPELTEMVLDHEGWYQTGDLATVNESNNIVILGRKKDLIKKGGQSLIPSEVERLLMTHPMINQAVLVGIPHPTLGEKVISFVVKNEGAITSQELKVFCSKRIAAYKVPDLFTFVEEIPTNNGKADRLKLRKMALSL